jgi:hypothetical protein
MSQQAGRLRWFALVLAGAVLAMAERATPAGPVEMPGGNSAVAATVADQLRSVRAADGYELTIPVDGADAAAQLRMRPLHLLAPGAQFVRGTADGGDERLPIDAGQIRVLRSAETSGDSSRAILVVSDTQAVGLWQRGPGDWLVLHGDPRDPALKFRPAGGEGDGAASPDLDPCSLLNAAETAAPLPTADRAASPGPHVLELAVDTDYAFRQLFPSAESATMYLVALYAAVADIFARDLNVAIQITFLRVWDATDPYAAAPNPMTAFYTYWSANMGGVKRDAAQLLSGRRDLPFTGTAFFNSACFGLSYCAVGFAKGWTREGGLHRWDIAFAAHELAHVLGAEHTHNLGLDACAPVNPGVERRGTIMSYCSAHNGGIDNTDLRFHAYVQRIVRGRLASFTCLMADCNRNGIADAQDVSAGASLDANSNAVPDECEDCDGDGERDDVEIAKGAPDVDNDGVPDSCSDDCNANAIPDRWETFRGIAADVDGNATPDVCQEDCDGDGTPDVAVVYLVLDSDVDRNARPDACDDCDLDGMPDLVELAGAHRVWVANATTSGLRSYHPGTGARWAISQGPPLVEAHDLLVTPDGRLLVALPDEDRIATFDGRTGAVLPDFAPPASAGLDGPAAMTLSPAGHVLVANRDGNDVRELDLATGSLRRVVVFPSSGGLERPHGLAVSPSGLLFVGSDERGEILAFDAENGSFRGVFVSSNGEALASPRGLALRPNGNLLVASLGTGVIAEFDGQTGAYLGAFNGPTSSVGNLMDPWAIRVGPNGNVFASVYDQGGAILEYDGRTGMFLRGYVDGPFAGLNFATGFGFVPGDDVDCNFNQRQDDCDLAANPAADADGDGVLDECAIDCDGNGVRDDREILPLGWRYDCNFNGVLDDCELAGGAASDADGDGLIDACDRDGDNDWVEDAADICPASPPGERVRPDNGAPFGDFDGDCAVTLADLAGLTACLDAGGPQASPSTGCLAGADFDRDGDVDLRDFAGIQATGLFGR